MSTQSLYRLEVAPLLILPLSRSPYFSYTSSVPVTKGSLVSISFGRQMTEGVVFGCQELPGPKPQWMKPISGVIQESFLTEAQCALAEVVSDEYFTPLGKTLKHFLPKIVRARKQKTLPETKKKKGTLRAGKEESALLKKLSQSKQSDFFLDLSLFTDQKKILLLIAKEFLKKDAQVLIIAPEVALISGLAARFREAFASEEVAVLHSRLSPGAFFAEWERIRTKEARIVIATRQGLFAPFQDLQAVIVTEEQDESYKQWDMSPRYHGKRVAHFLTELSQAKLILSSGTPSAESIWHIEEKRLIPLSAIAHHPPLGSALTIVNLKLERYRKNFSPLSEALVQELHAALGRGEQALLYINRQGMNAFSVCEQCKNVFRCKNCDHPLTSTKEGNFRCAECGFATPLFPNCPSCGHLTFRHIGFGTEKVEKELSKLFPRARIVRMDSTTQKTGKTIETLYERGMSGKIDILVGTQMILKDPPLPKLSLIAMIDADSLLLFPDFQADEKLYQSLSRAVRQVSRKDRGLSPGKVLVQTFRPESAFFQKAVATPSETFFKQTLAEREELFYPPFSRSLSITCQGKSEKAALKESEALFSELTALIPKTYRLRRGEQARFLKRQSLFESALLMRFPSTEPLPEKLTGFLKRKNKDCIIDIDPLSLR